MIGFLNQICTFEEVEEMDSQICGVSNCTILNNFGPLKKYEHYESIWLVEKDKEIYLQADNIEFKVELKVKI